MKLNKLFAVAFAALTLTACSDDNDVNTASDVTVAMQSDQMSVSEDFSVGTYYQIPVVVNGTTNGPVKLTIEVAAFGENGAVEGENFLFTSKDIVIPKGQNLGYFEFYPQGDKIVNQDRQFAVTITKAEGATISDKATCIVTLVDNEKYLAEAYEKVQGSWKFTGTNPNSGTNYNWNVTLTGYAEDEEGYQQKLIMSGIQGYEWCSIEVDFSFDAATMRAQLVFNFGQFCAYEVDFGDVGLNDVMWAGVSGNSLVSAGSVIASADAEYKNVEFPASAAFVGALFPSDGSAFEGYTWFWVSNPAMSR